MSNAIDTKDWTLSAFIHWKPKRTPKMIGCSYCSGIGTIGGVFHSLDDPTECPECYGKGTVVDPNDLLDPIPYAPRELIDHMQAAWDEFFDRPEQSYDAKRQKEIDEVFTQYSHAEWVQLSDRAKRQMEIDETYIAYLLEEEQYVRDMEILDRQTDMSLRR